jgi:membrane-bound metal-dependent hydrolase YbcI (DUF457 family)
MSPPPSTARALKSQAIILALVAAAPDLDLLIGQHRAQSHSIGVAAMVACLAAWRRWPVAATRARIWLVIFACWCTHPFLDALAYDNSPPQGVMAFWPFTSEYFQTGWSVFEPVWRNFWLRRTFRHDILAALREVLILLPVIVVTWWFRVRPRSVPAPR